MASGSIIEYVGRRGTVYRIKFKDAASRQVMRTIGPDRRAAEQALRHALTDIERDGYREPDKLAFREFADRWLDEHLPARDLKPTTVQNYKISVERHLSPFFGDYTLAELEQRPELIDRYVAAKAKQKLARRRSGTPLST